MPIGRHDEQSPLFVEQDDAPKVSPSATQTTVSSDPAFLSLRHISRPPLPVFIFTLVHTVGTLKSMSIYRYINHHTPKLLLRKSNWKPRQIHYFHTACITSLAKNIYHRIIDVQEGRSRKESLSERVSHMILRAEQRTHYLQTFDILEKDLILTLIGDQKAALGS